MGRVKRFYDETKTSPWVARWYVNRKRKLRFFATRQERDDFAREQERLLNQYGSSANLAQDRMARWVLADQLIGTVDPVEVAQFWLEHKEKTCPISIADAVDEYNAHLHRRGYTHDHQRHGWHIYQDFADHFKGREVHTISKDEVRKYLYALPHKQRTVFNYRMRLSALWSWAVKQGFAFRNIVSEIEMARPIPDEPGILTVAQVETLMRSTLKHDRTCCMLFALQLFGGMRTSAVTRLDYSELDSSQKAILTPATKTKRRRRQYIEGLPDNLWAWLALAKPSDFTWSAQKYLTRKRSALIRAGLAERHPENKVTLVKTIPQNAFRHSFVSYHVALHKNPSQTALLISHRGKPTTLYDHYLGVANEADARAYFSLIP